MIDYIQLFGASLLLVSCKSFQQENVIHRKWKLIPPTSYIFAFAELLLLSGGYGVITAGGVAILYGAIWMGTGAWMGCFLSMWVHELLSSNFG